MSLLNTLTPWWNTFLNLIYPTICTCIVCERALSEEYLQQMNLTEIPESRLWLCDICQQKVQSIQELGCVVCGRIRQGNSTSTAYQNSHYEPFQHPDSHRHQSPLDIQICNECQSHERPFSFARAAVRYSDTAKDLIRILKFESNKEAATWLGEWLCQAWDRHYAGLPLDFIIPVPLHPERLRQRGFNQAFMLADILSKYSKIPILESLQRIQTRSSQATRNRFERLQSLDGAFQCNPNYHEKLNGANILLIDDVFTTGATVEACTNVLLQSGCANVWVLTVAR